ncbi:MAG: hypothetical protein Q9183_000663 [Haloplaca sp. 2 TL-2023]
MSDSPASFFSNPSSGHALPPPLGPTSPLQHSRVTHPQSQQQHQPRSPPVIQHQSTQAQNYSLPALGPAFHQQQSPHVMMTVERERDRESDRERILADFEIENQHRRRNEIANQERMMQGYEPEMHGQSQREREHDASPREGHTGSIPLQQPVPSRGQGTLNGILAHLNPGNGSTSQTNAAAGTGNVFQGNNQPTSDGSPRSFAQQQVHNIPPSQLLGGFSQAVNTQQLPNGMAALSQGQQPILNDALSYLDQVKVRFVDHPDVYNRFLDIMKDFKSQTIDTPGVIDRVSTLFAGHPELIQGFNTFLPPGYRIECGTRDDPNTIRVTTPMGTTVSQMPSAPNRLNGSLNGVGLVDSLGIPRPNSYVDGVQADGEAQVRQEYAVGTPETQYISNARHGAQSGVAAQQQLGQGNIGYERDEAEAAAIAHQQEQRGVSHLSHAVSAMTTNGVPARHPLTQRSPTPGQLATLNQAGNATAGANYNLTPAQLEKRGPVEFNHAIGYVNKIKNRFSQHPDIYKQFLEILQTYQRDLKPIQDVYTQVTQLFASAPDLLEDFKQFLPESAAQAKAQAAAARQATEDAMTLSHARGDAYGNGVQAAQSQTPKPEMRMPPVGNFAPPPSVGKESKKRRGGAGSQITGGAAGLDPSMLTNQATKASNIRGGPPNKRTKLEQQKPVALEPPAVSPSLVPSLPQPMPPSTPASTTQDELHYFDRVKKYMSNKQTFNEFLKLCNLYTQELIDKNKLVHKASNLIGANAELMNWLRDFVEYDGRDVIVENKPRLPGDKVVLSKCRGLGPSYRLLPRRERLRTCSGRDEMCKQVLNDEWVSHPTWASEDSGFIAHRKNMYEESIHRIEEERHDYDFNIEACLRTIQLIEPIIQQLKAMSEEERATYVLPRGIGGQSETIYQRVIKKIYDRKRGQNVIDDMFTNPVMVLPIVLGRLKQKVEEWKASMREWEKVWREQTLRMFWRSLDHQGIQNKNSNKRQLQPKALQDEIQNKYEEQKRQFAIFGRRPPRFQLSYNFDDEEILLDTCHLVLTSLHNSDNKGNDDDKKRLANFLTTFIPTFFGLDQDAFQAHMSDIHDSSPSNEEMEDESVNEDTASGRPRRAVNGKKSNLLRSALQRGRPGKDLGGRESKDSTPDISSMDDDGAVSTDTPQEQPGPVDVMDYRWMEHPNTGNIDPKASYTRQTFNMYASLNIYCFFRTFQVLYERLVHIKENEKQVHEDVGRANAPKAAHDLHLAYKKPSEYFEDTSPSANYYHQVLAMCEDVMKGKTEQSHLEDTLRRFYMMKGWQLYTYDKLVAAIVRFAQLILLSDNKDKSLDIVNLFYSDRAKEETTHDAEIIYRKQVDKLTKDADIYRISYTPESREATISVFKKDDPTFSADAMEESKQWAYYISSYGMREATEGVPAEKMHWPYLRRNLPNRDVSEEEMSKSYLPASVDEGLVARINPDSYRIAFQDPGTTDRWLHRPQVQTRGLDQMKEASSERKRKISEKFGDEGSNIKWAKDLSQDEVEKRVADYKKYLHEGFPTNVTSNGNAVDNLGKPVDSAMTTS